MELFLDANSHITQNKLALKAYADFNTSRAGHGHPSSPNVLGKEAAIALETARAKIAELLGAKESAQIVFASTCTEACEWGISILANISGVIYYSPTEHPAVKQPVEKYCPDAIKIKVNNSGIIQKEIFDRSSVICVHMQNEIGIIQPIENISSKYLFSDMSQSVGKISFKLSSLPVSIATFGAHKFGGPSLGLLYLKDNSIWKEFGTGSRYYLDRVGTPDTISIVSSAVALEDAIKTLPERTEKMKEFQTELETGLINMGYNIIGYGEKRSYNTTFVHLGQSKGLLALIALGNEGIYCGLGSACSKINTDVSPLMNELDIIGGPHDFLRISQWGNYGKKEAKYFLDKLNKET